MDCIFKLTGRTDQLPIISENKSLEKVKISTSGEIFKPKKIKISSTTESKKTAKHGTDPDTKFIETFLSVDIRKLTRSRRRRKQSEYGYEQIKAISKNLGFVGTRTKAELVADITSKMNQYIYGDSE